ncbi:MAG: hypothetical protein LBS19_13485 [Clostridiales bacterium]|jgi:hypothetical protein|nr:hypothetical protein [Clostridiales bacterium]
MKLTSLIIYTLFVICYFTGAEIGAAVVPAAVLPARFKNEGVSPAELVRHENLLRIDGGGIPDAVLSRALPRAEISDGMRGDGMVRCDVTQAFGNAELLASAFCMPI